MHGIARRKGRHARLPSGLMDELIKHQPNP
jgi:hypothetical protein